MFVLGQALVAAEASKSGHENWPNFFFSEFGKEIGALKLQATRKIGPEERGQSCPKKPLSRGMAANLGPLINKNCASCWLFESWYLLKLVAIRNSSLVSVAAYRH